MSAPEGYTELATLSYSYKGEYSADSTYNKYNTVYSEGSTYVSLQDDNTGHKPSNDGVWWKYVARGFLTEDASEIEATDTYGITDDTPTPAGGLTKKSILQTWLDKAANRIVNKLVANDNFQAKLMEFLVNNGTTNLEGYGLDARFGKTLQDQVSELYANNINKQGLTCNVGLIENGGYTLKGNLVIVNTRIKLQQTIYNGTQITVSGFPHPRLNGGSNTVPLYANIPTGTIYMNHDGIAVIYSTEEYKTDTVIMFSCCYII